MYLISDAPVSMCMCVCVCGRGGLPKFTEMHTCPAFLKFALTNVHMLEEV